MGRTPARRGESPNLLVKIGTRGVRFNPSAPPDSATQRTPPVRSGCQWGSGAQVLAPRCRDGKAPEDGREVAAPGPRTCLGSDASVGGHDGRRADSVAVGSDRKSTRARQIL